MTHAPTAQPSLQLPARLALLLIVLACGATALAQGFDAQRYYQQCLRFEAGGDLETARQSCLNAVSADPGMDEARLALARLELARGDLPAAEQLLQQLRERVPGAEPLVLLAEVYLRSDRETEAETLLQEAASRLGEQYDSELAGRRAFLAAQLAERRGRYDDALRDYRQAISADPLSSRYRTSLASLLFETGEVDAAQRELQSFLEVSGETGDADLRALLGRVLWAQGDLAAGARELEAALTLRTGRETAAQAEDLRALALVYYGQGNSRAGGLALRDALRRGNLLSTIFGGSLLWLLLLLVLVALHVVGESRIAPTTTVEVIEGPQQWTVASVYRTLLAAVLVGLVAALLYGIFVFDNLLAVVTPVQSTDVRAIFLLVFSVAAAWLAARRVRLSGWEPGAQLLGRGDQSLAGVGLGLALLIAALLYLTYLPDSPWRGATYLDLTRLSPAIVAALVLIPLSELFFRPYAFPALVYRYGEPLAVLMTAALYALVLGTPVLLLLLIGWALSSAFRRTRSGGLALSAQLTFHLALLAGVAFIPWIRSLFL